MLLRQAQRNCCQTGAFCVGWLCIVFVRRVMDRGKDSEMDGREKEKNRRGEGAANLSESGLSHFLGATSARQRRKEQNWKEIIPCLCGHDSILRIPKQAQPPISHSSIPGSWLDDRRARLLSMMYFKLPHVFQPWLALEKETIDSRDNGLHAQIRFKFPGKSKEKTLNPTISPIPSHPIV